MFRLLVNASSTPLRGQGLGDERAVVEVPSDKGGRYVNVSLDIPGEQRETSGKVGQIRHGFKRLGDGECEAGITGTVDDDLGLADLFKLFFVETKVGTSTVTVDDDKFGERTVALGLSVVVNCLG